MNRIFLFFFLMMATFGFSQKSKINLDDIKKEITDKDSEFYYQKMLFKYKGLPKSIDSVEAQHLYYGRTFLDKTISTSDKSFRKLLDDFKKQDYAETITKANQLLSVDPTNLDLLMIMLQCYDKQQDVKNFTYYLSQFKLLTSAILDSGDGKSEDSAYLVNSVGDEYILINVIQIPRQASRSSKPATGGMFDIWENNNTKTYIKVIYNDF
ncbi:DUF4919 domain-containing protein [Epilithonimonas ginsengisoli]|uniref:DUF4919 domain-containing protein n=1 Tax=Epilithonimonas ginsengisoli TaxID=1245592 RepID=A0ABU4JEJ5_9FLAO|nr:MULTISPECIES: DUF4919 domain-containing protein [Chryseobacterium group]MBV6879459.1 DUF4919 domain-containing protein [Epilithonimonas sp. FP105]MDW8548095.1 DUF4919 domain-containing protein [Epilithonimonas ginsengisoli]OAH64465.1 hypothetical protein AXA65_19095 [Chryseobacterium sp. FP211-J200]